MNTVLFTVSLVLLTGLMFLTATDVTGRFFGHPLRGAYQISEIMQVAIVCLAWPFTTEKMAHVRLDLLISRFPGWVQNKIDILTQTLSLVVFSIIAWQGVLLVRQALDLGDLIAIVDIPLFPFLIVIPIGAGANCFVLLVQLSDLLTEARKGTTK